MKNGFTLIELLVVVLIIGILAAIAVPKYTKIIEKSKAAEAENIIGSLLRAEKVYLLTANANSDFNLSDLSITLPGAIVIDSDGNENIYTKDFKYRATLSMGATPKPYAFATRVIKNQSQYTIMRGHEEALSCNPACCWYTEKGKDMCNAAGYAAAAPNTCATTSLGCAYH